MAKQGLKLAFLGLLPCFWNMPLSWAYQSMPVVSDVASPMNCDDGLGKRQTPAEGSIDLTFEKIRQILPQDFVLLLLSFLPEEKVLQLWDPKDEQVNRILDAYWKTRVYRPRLIHGFTAREMAYLISSYPFTQVEIKRDELEINEEEARILAESRSIQRLDLQGQRVGAIGAFALARNNHLKSLNLSENQLGDEGLQGFENSTLEVLDLSYNQISDHGLRPLLTSRNLIQLSLEGNQIRNDGLWIFADHPTLKELNLSSNKIGDSGIETFRSIKNLKKLNLEKNLITFEGVQRAFTESSALTHLNLAYNEVGYDGFEYLIRVLHLEELNLNRNRIGSIPSQFLAPHPELKSLNLSGNSLQDQDLEFLDQFQSLSSLYLASNQLTSKVVKRIKKSHTLRVLDLSGNRIDPVGLSELNALQKEKGFDLNVDRNSISPRIEAGRIRSPFFLFL